MRVRAAASARAWLRGRFGIWPLYEARNKALGWPGSLLAWRDERREVVRLGSVGSSASRSGDDHHPHLSTPGVPGSVPCIAP